MREDVTHCNSEAYLIMEPYGTELHDLSALSYTDSTWIKDQFIVLLYFCLFMGFVDNEKNSKYHNPNL